MTALGRLVVAVAILMALVVVYAYAALIALVVAVVLGAVWGIGRLVRRGGKP